MTEFLQDINWSPLWISLKTGAVATLIAFFLGIFCARKIMKLHPGARAVLDGVLTMPLVLPPHRCRVSASDAFQPQKTFRRISF